MVLLAQHLARHRLREPQLLETIAHFLVVQEAQLSSKVGLPPRIPFCPATTTPLGSAVSVAVFLCGTLCLSSSILRPYGLIFSTALVTEPVGLSVGIEQA